MASNYYCSSICIEGLDLFISSQQIYDKFVKFGEIISCILQEDEYGKSKGTAILTYRHKEDADEVVNIMDGKKFRKNRINVSLSIKSFPIVKLSNEQKKCFVRNFGDIMNDLSLKILFEKFGNVKSAQVIINNGISRGFGFVSFTKSEYAEKAINEMNGYVLNNKVLYVAIAFSKNKPNLIKYLLETESNKTDVSLVDEERINHSNFLVNKNNKMTISQTSSNNNQKKKRSRSKKSKVAFDVTEANILVDERSNVSFPQYNEENTVNVNFECSNSVQNQLKESNSVNQICVTNEEFKMLNKDIDDTISENRTEMNIRPKYKFKISIDIDINFSNIKNQIPLKIMKDLNKLNDLNNKSLKSLFKKFGDILSAYMIYDNLGVSKRFGFVNFKKCESASKAIKEMNGFIFKNQVLRVKENNFKPNTNIFVKIFNIDDFINCVDVPKRKVHYIDYINKKDKNLINETMSLFNFPSLRENDNKTNLYVLNFSSKLDQVSLYMLFKKFGKIISTTILLNKKGCSERRGFVNFQKPKSANKAINEMDGLILNNRELFVEQAKFKGKIQKIDSKIILKKFINLIKEFIVWLSVPYETYCATSGLMCLSITSKLTKIHRTIPIERKVENIKNCVKRMSDIKIVENKSNKNHKRKKKKLYHKNKVKPWLFDLDDDNKINYLDYENIYDSKTYRWCNNKIFYDDYSEKLKLNNQ